MEHRNIIDYDKLPRYGKETFDGVKTKNHGCGGRCFVFYVEDRWYQVECERCGTVAYFKMGSQDHAIKLWNIMPESIGMP